MRTGSVVRSGAARKSASPFVSFLWMLVVTTVVVAHRAGASICAFIAAGGTLTAVEVPEGLVRYRSGAVPAWDFAVSDCIVAGANRQLYCGVSQIFRPLGERLLAIPPASSEQVFPTTAFVFDPQSGRRTQTLPFRALRWSYHAGRDLLAANDSEVVHLYSPAAGRLQGQLFVNGQPVSMAFDDGGSALFVVYFPEDSEGLAVAEVNVDTGRTQRTMPFPTGYDPRTFVKPPGRRLGYFARYDTALPTGDRTLVVLDLDRFEVARVLDLPGEVRAMQPREDGSALYISYATRDGAGIALLAIPEDRVLTSIATGPVAPGLATAGPAGWVVTFAGYNPAVVSGWTEDLSEQVFRHEFPYTTGQLLVWEEGPCPAAKPCVADCNADGRVSVDEVVRAVNIALGAMEPPRCFVADQSGDGAVTVEELVRAVGDLLSGCDG